MNQSKFVKYHVPCPECKSTDACSINEDGSAKCFSCDAFFPKYSNGTVMSTENYNKLKKLTKEGFNFIPYSTDAYIMNNAVENMFKRK